ncbi:MAG TPA: hypothetical protein PKL31_05465 [Fulvivirga sp.]|nr:hypothetical protein [Fulvivirga sp.]
MFNIFNWFKPAPDPKYFKFNLIVSTGRTGTKYLGKVLNQPKMGIVALHEPKPNLENIGYDLLTGKITNEQAKEAILKNRKRIMSKVGNLTYIESNGGMVFLLPLLADIFPLLKVVHIVRNPIDLVKSGVNRSMKVNGEIIQKYAMEERWRLKASDIKNDPYSHLWNEMDIYQRFMWLWNIKNKHIADFLKTGNRGITIKFEDIFHQTDNIGFDQLIKYFSLPDEIKNLLNNKRFESAKNKNAVTFAQNYEDWPEDRKLALKEICNDLASKYNYSFH